MAEFSFGMLEKAAIVIEIGAAYTKVGYAGERCPRDIVRTRLLVGGRDEISVGSGTLGYSAYTQGQWRSAYDYFLKYLFFNVLQVNPTERRVILCEDLLCPHVIRDSIARVLFQRLHVPSVCFANANGLPTYCTRWTTGLVIDVGFFSTRVLPICDGSPLLYALVVIPAGARRLHDRLSTLLHEAHPSKFGDTTIPSDILEDVIARVCFVSPSPSSDASVRKADSTLYKSSSFSKKPVLSFEVPGEARQFAAEVLFDDSDEDSSIPAAILKSLAKCTIEVRAAVVDNLILAGGVAMIPGFGFRLQKELSRLCESAEFSSLNGLQSKIRFANHPFQANYLTWLGGSILGALEGIAEQWIKREEYTGQLPDWSRISPIEQ